MRIKKIILAAGIIFIAFLLFSCLLPPIRHKKIDNAYKESLSSAFLQEDSAEKERVLCIDDNEEALIWRLRAVQEAEKEIILSTFDFGDDNSGKDMMSALMDAADRGVRIRIFIDGINGTLKLSGSSNFKALVSLPGVEARFYNPIDLLKPWKCNYRMHDKYLIADDKIYILGGRNTNDLFLGNYRDKYNIDRDILVYNEKTGEGSSIVRLKNYFESIWALDCNKDVTDNGTSKRVKDAAAELREHYEDLKRIYPGAFSEMDWKENTLEAENIVLCTNPMEPVNKAPELWYILYRFMQQGDDVIIQTPYIICSNDMYKELTSLYNDGKRIRLVTNAVENGANPWGCTDYLNQKGRIRNTGSEVYEVMSDQSLHTKTILIDDNISIVGSYNLDIRSTYLDTEMMLVIDSPGLNEYLQVQTEQLMDQSRHVFPDGTETYGEQYAEIKMGFGKKCIYTVLRIIVYPFRYLL